MNERVNGMAWVLSSSETLYCTRRTYGTFVRCTHTKPVFETMKWFSQERPRKTRRYHCERVVASTKQSMVSIWSSCMCFVFRCLSGCKRACWQFLFSFFFLFEKRKKNINLISYGHTWVSDCHCRHRHRHRRHHRSVQLFQFNCCVYEIDSFAYFVRFLWNVGDHFARHRPHTGNSERVQREQIWTDWTTECNELDSGAIHRFDLSPFLIWMLFRAIFNRKRTPQTKSIQVKSSACSIFRLFNFSSWFVFVSVCFFLFGSVLHLLFFFRAYRRIETHQFNKTKSKIKKKKIRTLKIE